MEKIKIMVVDDHEVIRAGIRVFVERMQEMEVVAEAATAKEAVAGYGKYSPDVVLMDIQLPGASGIEACRDICHLDPAARVLMLSCYTDDDLVVSSIMAGAKGYVSKVIGGNDLINAIKTVYNGGSSLDPDVTNKVIAKMKEVSKQQDEEASLSLQEKKIITLIAEGKTNRQIASELCLSDKTIKNYVSSILSKLGLNNRAEAAAYAVRMNFNKSSYASDMAIN